MSESEEHRCLVEMMARRLAGMNFQVFADLPTGFARPQKIAGFIPDVYGLHRVSGGKYIGEAKTRIDLETAHSREQITAFIAEANKNPTGVFILAGFGETATHAKTLLYFLLRQHNFSPITVRVFDGLDLWQLNNGEHPIWHLC